MAAKAQRIETPGPNGPAVWHRWEGSGPPLVLLHGGWGSWTHWYRSIPLLTPHFTLLTPDIPGCGDSGAPPKPTSPDDIADILVAGLDELVPAGDTFHLAGFSFGGLIGSVVASKTPGRCRSFVAVGASGFGTLHAPPQGTALAKDGMSEDEIDELQRRNLQILMLHDAANIDDLAVHMHRKNLERGRIRSRPISLTDRLLKALPDIKASMAGIWGEHDVTVMGREGLEKRKEIIRSFQPDAPFHVIKDAGHWVMYETPDMFADTLVGTLKTLTPY
ncbi:MAG: alpha/beta hydrolase [Rhodospirillales bacterium]